MRRAGYIRLSGEEKSSIVQAAVEALRDMDITKFRTGVQSGNIALPYRLVDAGGARVALLRQNRSARAGYRAEWQKENRKNNGLG